MKKIIASIFLFFLLVNTVFAHPLDISVSTWNIKSSTFKITTYFHTFEIDYLLKENWINSDWVIYYYDNSDLIKKYITENSYFKNSWNICEIENIELIEDEPYKIATDGLWVNYSFKCEEKIQNFDLKLDYFTNFPLQTNRIILYDYNNWIKNLKPILYKVLTSKIANFDLDLNNLNVARKDSDKDWLSDEEEKLYYTDPNNIDTDNDNYTDKEEIDYGWNPLNKELSPWQEHRETLDIELSNEKIDALSQINLSIKQQNLSDYWYWNDYLKSVMKYINDYFEKNNWNLFWVFFVIFLLWILHAVWPWHSKWLLIAYTLEKENWYKKGLLFAFIFTITHMIDIVILFFITKIVITFIDPSKYSYYLQIFSWIMLFVLSLYLIYNSIFRKKNKKTKPSLAIAFLAWLAPCSFAWSIYLLLIALWKTLWIIPLIFALWLWILTTLVTIVVISIFLRNKTYSKIKNIWKYWSIFSSLIIFIISIIMITNILIF